MPWPGVFPFGRPSTARPARSPSGTADAFVLGVYPSALHVRWTPPAWHAGDRAKAVGALAVDVEPIVFLAGRDPDPATLISEWKETVGFSDGDDVGCDGRVMGVHLNGSSGASVAIHTLEPLGLEPARVWMTDTIPWFLVKYGTATKREQGDVFDDVYNPYAKACGRPAAVMPRRPAPAALVAEAISNQATRLRNELLESGAPVIYTLGEEARQVLVGVADKVGGPPSKRLTVDDYGGVGDAVVEGRTVAWHALAHPGQRAHKWVRAHGLWTGTWAD